MLGIIPAAGRGSRMQPLGFSKELLPVGSRHGEVGDRPRAVSEYLLERMVSAGADKLCFVIGPGKSDILEYYAAGFEEAASLFVVQPSPRGLCDAVFRAAPLVGHDETVLVGLPDTVWFPVAGYSLLPDAGLSLLLFPVDHPERFDAVLVDDDERVVRIDVKRADAGSHWVWGGFKLDSATFHGLHELWLARSARDEFFGTLINAWLEAGGEAWGVRAGETYVDVGTVDGYREALALLAGGDPPGVPVSSQPERHGASAWS